MNKRPSKDLAAILSQRNTDGRYDAIIERAANNGYHDYKFEKIPGHPEYAECICPKMQLVQDLSAFPELEDIRRDVMNGLYDDSADAEDQQEMRGWLMEDNAPDFMFEDLGLKVPTQQEREQFKNAKKLN